MILRCETAGIEGAVAKETIKLGNKGKKTTEVREIADALGISIGTVDGALHNRPEVNLKTKAQVLRMAEQLPQAKSQDSDRGCPSHLSRIPPKTACDPHSAKATSDPN